MSGSEMKPVTDQPEKGANWMPLPEGSSGGACPPGLEYLTQVDQILMHQQVEMFEVITNIQMRNRYVIKNSLGQQIYFAHEVSSFCHRCWCKQLRGFYMPIMDYKGEEVMRIVRPFKCCAGCCWCADTDCCAFVLQVEAPVGNVVGSLRQRFSKWTVKYDVLDLNGDVVLTLQGPCCPCQCVCGCTDDVDFNVQSASDGSEIGKISKQWGGWVKEAITQADNFRISFPMDLDVKIKATLIGAAIMLEFALYEQNNN